jgi:hypothetical protein
MNQGINVELLNWAYFAISVLGIVWAVFMIWAKATSKSSRNKTYFGKYKDKNLKKLPQIISYIWRKDYKKLIFLATIVLSWFVLFSDNIISIENIPAKDELTALVLLATAAVVFWYTRETNDLKEISTRQLKETRKQIDMQLKPYLRLQWNNEDNNKVYDIVNEGEGLALDVEFAPIPFQDQDLLSVFQIKSRPLIAKSKATSVTTSELVNPDNFVRETVNIKGYLEQKFDLNYKIKATYLDVEKRKYKVIFKSDETYNDKFKIVEQDRI